MIYVVRYVRAINISGVIFIRFKQGCKGLFKVFSQHISTIIMFAYYYFSSMHACNLATFSSTLIVNNFLQNLPLVK